MDYRLIALTGPPGGQVFEIPEGELSIGRQAACDLRLAESTVSRRHALVRREGDRVELVDLDSRHGTFVNGLPVGERTLEDGDRVVIGGSTFLVRLQPDTTAGAESASAMVSDTAGLAADLAETALSLPVASALFLDRARLDGALAADDRVARSLAALLGITTAVQRHRRVRPLVDELLDRLLEALPAQRAAVLLSDGPSEDGDAGGESFATVAARQPSTPGEPEEIAPHPFEISGTALDRVMRERSGLLAADVHAEHDLAGAESVHVAGVRSLLCVPLLDPLAGHGENDPGRGEEPAPLGVIYLDTLQGSNARFDEQHLELATAVAVLVAGPLAAARRWERLERENERLREAALGSGLVGESPALERVAEMIARVAPTDSTVLLRGESGTGKEVTARAIHRSSPRRRGPFVAVNCASLVDTLLESELFGHERGAFTGAVGQKEGQLELADGGTLFLDEVGEMPLGQQAKLLRVLEERTVVRVGSTRPRKIDVRLIAATNRDLERAVDDGTFRRDLYHRLNVIGITLPPLRERGSDVLLLARHFADRVGTKVGRRVTGFSDAARARLLAHDWPGNVRELANAVERAVVLGSDDVVRAEDLPEALLEAPAPRETEADASQTYHEALNGLKRRLILDAVDGAGGNITRAAERLDLHPNHLHRLIRNLGLRAELDSR